MLLGSVAVQVIRSTVNFHRSIWGDQFLTYNEREDQAWEEEQAKELKEKVRKELVIITLTKPMQHVKLMELIDAVQRLGVAYHFEVEIEESLNNIYVTYGDQWIDDNLQNTSLWFRILRQHGFNVSSAVQRWSTSCLDMLPEYMKFIYQELLDVHKEAEELLEKKGMTYRSYYSKEMVKEYTRNLLMEAKWVKEGYIPTIEEHMSVTLVTCAYAMIIAKCYVHGHDSVTEDTFKWVSTYPPLVKASCLILRLMDDIATHKEQERNHVASSIECYMKQYGVSEEETREVFSKQVEDGWKVINRESLRPTGVSRPLLMPPINLARVCDVLYKIGDNYNHVGKEMINRIKSLLVNPMIE
ncbi:hypothetical protein L6452_15622 [Arctium lappa]|uniref:Uncharacterized protein n=1 Tax=Arctium lappa TaxID=4217 RepID=A0ACB9CP68_ARCLA|nr:hypothetical protein L6452_15622 [Arctium lappa]